MKEIVRDSLITPIADDQFINSHQQQNITALLSLSKKFCRDAGIASEIPTITEETVILESGHQPNFFPYSGVWKKVILLDFIQNTLEQEGKQGIAIFGFADQNLSTARLLHENHIPSLNKQGTEKIGFKLHENQRWQCFNFLDKPDHKAWDTELKRISGYYLKQGELARADTNKIRERISDIIEIAESGYDRAKTFSDLNSFIFSKICNTYFNLNVHFFRYSDIQKEKLFLEEWKTILANRESYIQVYNQTIKNQRLDIPEVSQNYIPFWYHCNCGGKVSLIHITDDQCRGICPVCDTEYALSLNTTSADLDNNFKDMAPVAVARNIIFSEGLKTSLFVSGAGGSLQYGIIAEQIEKKLGTHIPKTISWLSKDYYIGIIQKIALNDFQKNYRLTKMDFINSSLNRKISDYCKAMQEKIGVMEHQPELKKDMKKYRGLFKNSITQAQIAQNIFAITPSCIDLFINVSRNDLLKQWRDTIEFKKNELNGGTKILQNDVIYPAELFKDLTHEEILKIFTSMHSIKVNS